jgi:hypothetical protein
VISASIVFGTCRVVVGPACAIPISDFDFARKNPVEWICGSSSAEVACASARASR